MRSELCTLQAASHELVHLRKRVVAGGHERRVTGTQNHATDLPGS
jgi:hypothetical protein